MPNQTTSDKHYDCKTCVNRGSPLCELCTQITSPSGKEHKPKYYIGLVEVAPVVPELRIPHGLSSEIEGRAITIARHLGAGLPIPIRAVLEYNTLVEHRTKKEE